MARVSGSLLEFGTLLSRMERPWARVFVMADGESVGETVTDADGAFSVEIPDDLRGEIEIRCDLTYTAPAFAVATGNDLEVSIPVNRTAGLW